MTDRDSVAALEQVRQLEGEIARLRRVIGVGEKVAAPAVFHGLEIDIAGTRFLIPIEEVREVVPMVWPEPVAGAPEWVMGSASYGGTPITLIDLGMRTLGEPTRLSPGLLAVITEGERWLGLVVSAAGDLHVVDAADLTTPGPDIPCAPFLLGLADIGEGRSLPVLSIRRIGLDLDD